MTRGTLKSNRTDKTSEDEMDEDRANSGNPLKKRNTIVEQKYYDKCDPKDINKIVQKFIMSLIWGFGAPLTSIARPKYSLFLHE